MVLIARCQSESGRWGVTLLGFSLWTKGGGSLSSGEGNVL